MGKNHKVKIIPAKEKGIDFEELLYGMMDTFNQILRMNVYEAGLTKVEIDERMEHKKLLRKALRNCAYGDQSSKIYVKDYIKDILVRKYKINSVNIDCIIPFSNIDKLDTMDQFDIMLYELKKEHGYNALDIFIQKNHLEAPKKDSLGNNYYEISKKDIQNIFYRNYYMNLTFIDKLNILTQRIYQRYKGNGVIDEIRDMRIDGVSAGVSGISEGSDCKDEKLCNMPASYESVWIFYKGKSIHLSFLSFGNKKELIRVCKNIYRYNSQGQLSEISGYIVNEMMDGSRVAVARPPFAESWVFFIRKFDSILQADMNELITDRNKELPIKLIQWLVKGCQITGITGEQGAGKTTLLISMVRFINPSYNLRIQELSYELHLRKIYPERNIVSFRETNSTSGQEGLDFQKKTDGTVSILGEVASAPVASWLVQMSLVASLFTLFTHHAKTAEDLVMSLRNSLLLEGGFHSERVATEQVVNTINFDIHMKKTEDGHRFIERITEIIPRKEIPAESGCNEPGDDLTGGLFITSDIIVFDGNQYVVQSGLSEGTISKIKSHLRKEEIEDFEKDLREWRQLLGKN